MYSKALRVLSKASVLPDFTGKGMQKYLSHDSIFSSGWLAVCAR